MVHEATDSPHRYLADVPDAVARLTRAYQVEPLNRLLHHYPARRMEAEAIRDSVLVASGSLDRTLGGTSIYPYREESNKLCRLFVGLLDGNGRRSIYIKMNLMEPTRFLSSFNTPGGKTTQGRRGSTNVPAQALLNDPFVLDQSKKWAQRILADGHSTPRARVNSMFMATLSLAGTEEELRQFSQLVSQFAQLHGIPDNDVMASEPIWKDLAHVMLNLKEFIFIP